MADDKPTKENQPAAERPFENPRRNLLTIIVVGSLMLVEGAGIFVAVKFMSGDPQSAEADEGPDGLLDAEGNLLPPETELRVTDVVAFNSKSGRVFVYQLTIYAEVETKHAERLEQILEHRQNTIEDRFSRIIRACDPKYMEEPGLETLRRQFQSALEDIVGGEAVIKQILIPQFSKSRAD